MALTVTVLVDNNTLIDRYFLAEPGLALHLEADGGRVLFDTGYSDVFLANASKLGIDLADLDYVALSHGHGDHTWGLEPLVRMFAERELERRPHRRPIIVAHPRTFISVRDVGFREGASLMAERKLARHFPLRLDTAPQWLSDRLVYLGEIPRLNEFEGALTFGRKEDEDSDDLVPEDSALAYRTSGGLVVLTGCAHAGICNTIEYARRLTGERRVRDVLGGFHLQRPSESQLAGTVAYFAGLQPDVLHACHCTDLASKIALSRVARVEEVGVGLSLHYE